VIKHFLKLASEKAEAAQAQAETLDGIDDLEASATPESLMLSYVSVENDKARADRQLVTPWFKCAPPSPVCRTAQTRAFDKRRPLGGTHG
jgi:hypothetical protein